MTQQRFKIGPAEIAVGLPPLFLPDIGTSFNNDIDLGLRVIGELREQGVTVVKGEILHDADICLDDETQVRYLDSAGNAITERYRALIERKLVSPKSYERVFSRAQDLGMAVVLSVYDKKGIKLAVEMGVAALKIATSNIVHQPLIEWVAQTKLPMLIDTGDSSLEEIDRAISWAKAAGAENIVIEHSPYPPPAPVERHDLRFMATLGQAFGLPFGLSDHHGGDEMLYAAIALGAAVVEKGVFPDHVEVEQDVRHGLKVSRVSEVMCKCTAIHAALGNPYRHLDRDRPKKTGRMGLVTRRAVSDGDAVSLETVDFAFPAHGIPVECWSQVQNTRFKRSIGLRTPIQWSDLDW